MLDLRPVHLSHHIIPDLTRAPAIPTHSLKVTSLITRSTSADIRTSSTPDQIPLTRDTDSMGRDLLEVSSFTDTSAVRKSKITGVEAGSTGGVVGARTSVAAGLGGRGLAWMDAGTVGEGEIDGGEAG